jgi:uncharacterized protein
LASEGTLLDQKVARLRAMLADLSEGAAVAFSGAADSPSLPRRELDDARGFALTHGVPHEVVPTFELENPAYAANDAYRCYHCKDELFGVMAALAAKRGLRWLLFGAVADDEGEWRPGMDAARERGVRAPLLEAGFTKQDVRRRSRDLGLETWDKPASACLASRFPAGVPITEGDLARVEEAERLLKDLGFRQCRVRLLEGAARIEVEGEDLSRFADAAVRRAVVDGLKRLEFRFITLDLEGFRSGSLSVLPLEKKYGIRRDT